MKVKQKMKLPDVVPDVFGCGEHIVDPYVANRKWHESAAAANIQHLPLIATVVEETRAARLRPEE